MLYSRPFVSTPNRLSSRFLAILLVLTALAVYLPSSPTPAGPTSATIAPDFGKLPMSFVPNAGQTDSVVRFQAHSMGSTLFFTPNEVVLSLPANNQYSIANDPRLGSPASRSSFAVSHLSQVRLYFEDANPAPEVIGSDRLPGTVNYFIGNEPDQWRTNLPTYRGIIYRDLYPGIDLHYEGGLGTNSRSFQLKGTYTVAPGADPTRIRWRYSGAASVRLDQVTGNLLIELPSSKTISDSQYPEGTMSPPAYPPGQAISNFHSQLIERAPIAWQTVSGRRMPVGVRYAVAADGSIGFVLDRYDPASPLILDPALTYSTYLGGSGYDYGYDIALDADGNAYVTGYTNSVDFPTLNAAQPDFGGGLGAGDVFVVKLNPTGSNLVYATYLGGRGNDRGLGIALDADGNTYVTGDTTSIDFPTQNPIQSDSGGGGPFEGDAFVAKLDATGSGLVYATYLGGIGDEIGYGIALDADGNAYVAGYTSSTNFPIANAVQPDPAFPQGLNVLGDAFVTTVIGASGVYTWGYSTYLGGTGSDTGYGIALDGSEDAYVTGETGSTDFPTANPFQAANAGEQDVFVTKVIRASGVYTWDYSTYLGGDGTDMGRDIAVDADGNAYLTGYAFSANFPTTEDAYDASCGTDGLCDNTGGDAFFTRLNAPGDVLAYSTYLGGGSTDFGHGIALDDSGDAYLAGFTYSADFPVTTAAYDTDCGTDGQCNGFVTDAFVSKMTMAPELLLTKFADPPGGVPVTQGDTITYTLVATNSGAPATNVVIADAIPLGTAYVLDSITTTLGVPDFDGTQVTVGMSDLSAGATLTATFQVRVTTGFTTTITNQATLSGDQVELQNSNTIIHPVHGTGELHTVYLPILLKGLSEPPPPPGCAPYLVATVDVGDTPRGIAIDTTQNRVYVANYGSSSLSVIDSSNMVIWTITGITSANGVAYDPTHNLIWVTNYSSDQVTPVDAASFSVLPSITVGDGPWGVAYDPVHDSIYVANSLGDSVTVVDAEAQSFVTTLKESFSQPYHVAANPDTGKVYVTNFGNHSVTVVNETSISSTVDLGADNPSTQPYGVAVDETRDLVYVATVDSHRMVVIGTDGEGTPDQLLGWAAFRRGFGDPTRPVPMRAIAINPDIGPSGDGGHLWTTTSSADGSEADQALLIPKGWDGRFSWPVPYDVGTNPGEGIAVDRGRDWVYVSSGATPGTVTVLGDSSDSCMIPFSAGDGTGFEVFPMPR